ncbi:MAG: hypothetical protein C4291_10760 [Candidatus Dadabacteria bacterium]
MGVNRRYIFTLLVLSLLGSYISIPIAELPARQIISNQEITFLSCSICCSLGSGVVAGNHCYQCGGGVVIPILLSIYLLVKNRIYSRALIGTAIVAAIVYCMAKPVSGLGIAVPIFIPPLMAAIVALLRFLWVACSILIHR